MNTIQDTSEKVRQKQGFDEQTKLQLRLMLE